MSKSGSFLLILIKIQKFWIFSIFLIIYESTIFEKEDFLEIVLFEESPTQFEYFAWA